MPRGAGRVGVVLAPLRGPRGSLVGALCLLLGLLGLPRGVTGGLVPSDTAAATKQLLTPQWNLDAIQLNNAIIKNEQYMTQKILNTSQGDQCPLEAGPLHCFTCLKAATEAECRAKGKLLQCTAQQPICAVFTMEEDNEMRVFSRMCHDQESCVGPVLGPKGKACDLIGSKAVCTYCEYGQKGQDYTCGNPPKPTLAPSPCDASVGETVWCRACTNVLSEQECRTTGSLVECPSAQHICEVTTHETQDSHIKRYSRQCSLATECHHGNKPKQCTGHGDSLNCKYCDYGVKGGDYACALPSPKESSACDDANQESLMCFTCTSAKNASHCRDIGHFQTCSAPGSVCEVRSQQSPSGAVLSYSRGCMERPLCGSTSLGPDTKRCSGSGHVTTCSYCHLGVRGTDYMCTSAPCEQQSGESLWCLTCHGATNLFDCVLRGTFTQCHGEQMACMSEVTTSVGQPDTFNRKCTPITHCPTSQLGTANQKCRDNGEEDRICSYCDFGLPDVHYQCKADVCDSRRNETLYCLSCQGAGSVSECLTNGEFTPCTGQQPICELRTTSLGPNTVAVWRGCQERRECPAGGVHVGSAVQDCQTKAGGKVCSHCEYGGLGSHYYCSQEGAQDTSPVCPGDDPTNCYVSLEAVPSPRGPVEEETVERGLFGESRTKREVVIEEDLLGNEDGSGASGSGWMNFEESLCSSELGEVPACWTCTAKSDAECWALGSFQPCLMPDPTCEYKYSVSKPAGSTEKGEIVEVIRQCSSRDWCSKAEVGPDSATTYDLYNFNFHRRTLSEDVVESYILPQSPSKKGGEEEVSESYMFPQQHIDNGGEEQVSESFVLPQKTPLKHGGEEQVSETFFFPQQPSDKGGEEEVSESFIYPQQPSDKGGEEEVSESFIYPQQPSDKGGEEEVSDSFIYPEQPSDNGGEETVEESYVSGPKEHVIETYELCGEKLQQGVDYVCVDPTEHGRSKRDLSSETSLTTSCHTGAAQRYTCHLSPDQHSRFTTFDGRTIDFDGDCKYLLSSTASMEQYSEADPRPYQVLIKRAKGGKDLEYVELVVGDKHSHMAMRIYKDNRIVVNNTDISLEALPTTFFYDDQASIRILRTGPNHVTVTANPGGLVLGYDGNIGLHLQMPEMYFNQKLQGLCGNLNGHWADDLTDRSGRDVSSLGWEGAYALGYSWQLPDTEDNRCARVEDCECEGDGVCIPHLGICRCPESRTGQLCQHESSSACSASGEPSIETFDGSHYDFSGPCRYLLTGTAPDLPSNLQAFMVFIQDGETEHLISPSMSLQTRTVTLEYDNVIVSLEPHSEVKINGERFEHELMEIPWGHIVHQKTGPVAIVMDFGLTITYDGFYQVAVQLADHYSSHVHGLCGDQDGVSHNDLTNACGHDVMGLQEDSGTAMGNSWQWGDQAHPLHTCRNTPSCDSCNGGLYLAEAGLCRCPVHQAGNKCQYNVSAQCVALGEPHYRTYDGAMLHYQGACKYLLSGTTASLPGLLDPFTVHLKNEHQDVLDWGSWTLYAEVKIKGHTIRMDRYLNVMVDSLSVSVPHRGVAGLDIHMYRGTGIRLRTSYGLAVTMDTKGRVTVRLPVIYSGHVEGVCGNYNHVYYDDYTTRDGSYVGDDKTARASLVGNSWKQPDPTDPGCFEPYEDEVPDTSSLTSTMMRTHAHCDLLFNTTMADNPFSPCLARLGNLSLHYLEACVYSAASAGHKGLLAQDRAPPTCGVLAAFAEECRFTAGVPVMDWRWKTGCGLECPAGLEASAQVPASPPSCVHPASTGYEELLGEGCTCPPGHTLDRTHCTPSTQCGCTLHGHYYPLDSEWLSHECGTINQCIYGDQGVPVVITKLYQCPGHSECKADNGKLTCQFECTCKNGGTCIPSIGKCRCPPNYIGKQCETEVTCCKAWGDPHYLTFSGLTVDFMGACRYQLTGTCPHSKDFEQFMVTALNSVPANQLLASKVKEVSIEISGHRVDLRDGGIVMIDEERHQVPVVVEDLSVYETPAGVLLETPSLRVLYGHQTVDVCLPRHQYSHTALCGICGSLGGPEEPVTDGDKYRVHYTQDDFCQRPSLGELLGGMPHSDGPWRRQVDQSPQLCGLLYPYITQGPFMDCWRALDSKVRSAYHASCRYDVYLYSGEEGPAAHSAACRSLAAVAQVCAGLGHPVIWRYAAKCLPSCPSGQSFQETTSACPATCEAPQAPRFCQLPATPGCACPPGLLVSGRTCVPPNRCGCLDEHQQYHTAGSHWYNEDCSVRYFCQGATSTAGSQIQKGPGCNRSNEICSVVDNERKCVPSRVDGGWGEWEVWSECVASPFHSGVYARFRVRECNNPLPQHGGNDCVGSAFEYDIADCQDHR